MVTNPSECRNELFFMPIPFAIASIMLLVCAAVDNTIFRNIVFSMGFVLQIRQLIKLHSLLPPTYTFGCLVLVMLFGLLIRVGIFFQTYDKYIFLLVSDGIFKGVAMVLLDYHIDKTPTSKHKAGNLLYLLGSAKFITAIQGGERTNELKQEKYKDAECVVTEKSRYDGAIAAIDKLAEEYLLGEKFRVRFFEFTLRCQTYGHEVLTHRFTEDCVLLYGIQDFAHCEGEGIELGKLSVRRDENENLVFRFTYARLRLSEAFQKAVFQK